MCHLLYPLSQEHLSHAKNWVFDVPLVQSHLGAAEVGGLSSSYAIPVFLVLEGNPCKCHCTHAHQASLSLSLSVRYLCLFVSVCNAILSVLPLLPLHTCSFLTPVPPPPPPPPPPHTHTHTHYVHACVRACVQTAGRMSSCKECTTQASSPTASGRVVSIGASTHRDVRPPSVEIIRTSPVVALPIITLPSRPPLVGAGPLGGWAGSLVPGGRSRPRLRTRQHPLHPLTPPPPRVTMGRTRPIPLLFRATSTMTTSLEEEEGEEEEEEEEAGDRMALVVEAGRKSRYLLLSQ